MKLSELKRIIREEIDNEIDRFPTMSKSAFPQTEKDSKEVYKDAESKRTETNTKEINAPLQAKDVKEENTGFGADKNKGMERLKYVNINNKYQDRVNALVMGKDSTLQKDINDKEQGVGTTGNEKFNNKAKEMNKYDNDHTGFGTDNKAAVQFGSDIEILSDEKPAHQDSAFENKIKKGDIFIESKKGLKLKVTGLSEDKKSVKFINENDNKSYSLLKENLKKAISNKFLVRESRDWFKYGKHNENEYELDDSWLIVKDEKFNNNLLNVFPELKSAIDISNPNIDKRFVTYDLENIENDPAFYKQDEVLEYLNNELLKRKHSRTYGFNNKQNITMGESKKRLKFNKTKFMCESHMKSLIPEHYKVDEKQFKMIDNTGNEYLIEWNNGKANILENKNEKAVQEQMKRMKQLWEHKPENTERDKQNL